MDNAKLRAQTEKSTVKRCGAVRGNAIFSTIFFNAKRPRCAYATVMSYIR